MRSNGWDNDTAALQLFSHLEGDTLHMALIVPLSRRLSRTGLVDALTVHYGSPGRLADYQRKFKRTTKLGQADAGDNEAKLMTKLAPEWVRTSDPVIRSPARYRWTTAPASGWLRGSAG